MVKVPCEECITVAICRHKPMREILKCSFFKQFIMDTNINGDGFRLKHRGKLVEILKPTKWELNSKGLIYVPKVNDLLRWKE